MTRGHLSNWTHDCAHVIESHDDYGCTIHHCKCDVPRAEIDGAVDPLCEFCQHPVAKHTDRDGAFDYCTECGCGREVAQSIDPYDMARDDELGGR